MYMCEVFPKIAIATRLRTLDLPVFPHPCLYAGDFNCRHADWGYDDNSPDGEKLKMPRTLPFIHEISFAQHRLRQWFLNLLEVPNQACFLQASHRTFIEITIFRVGMQSVNPSKNSASPQGDDSNKSI